MARPGGSAFPGDILAAPLVLLALALPACSKPRGPNVLIFVIDTLRADGLGSTGRPAGTSPAIDAFAEGALLVETAYAESSWTKPSVATLFTSQPSGEHRVLEEAPRNVLADDLVTLAEVFLAAGYRTAAFSENPHVRAATGFAQGFETFVEEDTWEGRGAQTVAKALEWLSSGGERPFFLYVHLLDPHDPYDPQPGDPLGGSPDMDEIVRSGRVIDLVDPERADLPRRELSGDELAALRSLYEGEVRETDSAFERLAAGLGRELEETIVLITSDHGEEFLEHGRLRHGFHLYEETLRVPLVLRAPGSTSRRETSALVAHIDVAPTLLELAGLAPPPSMRGRSFSGLVRGLPGGSPFVTAETMMRGVWLRAVRSGRWKLIRDELSGEERLFDLVEDPLEEVDLSHREPHTASDLRVLLRSRSSGRPHLGPEGSDPEMEEALRRLGYAGK